MSNYHSPNLQKFMIATEALESPTSFLEHAFYFAVSAALERRVYLGSAGRPTYLNQYLLFVGPPAVGKGVAMREASRLLSRFPLTVRTGDRLEPVIDPYTNEPRALFYRLPDATTFEQLIHELASAVTIFKPHDAPEKAFAHASAYFLLEELSSLMRIGKAEDCARLLLNLFDCEPFTYATKKNGRAVLKQGCLNLIGGTVESFLFNAEKSGILSEGILSRAIVIYEACPRKANFWSHVMSPEQEELILDLQKHLLGLSQLSGAVSVTDEAAEWLDKFWQVETVRLTSYDDPVVNNYTSRRKVQGIKLAAAIHFADSFEMTIPLAPFVEAFRRLERLEHGVVRLAKRTGRNEMYEVQERFLTWVRAAGSIGRAHPEVVLYLTPHVKHYNDITPFLDQMVSANVIYQEPSQMDPNMAVWKAVGGESDGGVTAVNLET